MLCRCTPFASCSWASALNPNRILLTTPGALQGWPAGMARTAWRCGWACCAAARPLPAAAGRLRACSVPPRAAPHACRSSSRCHNWHQRRRNSVEIVLWPVPQNSIARAARCRAWRSAQWHAACREATDPGLYMKWRHALQCLAALVWPGNRGHGCRASPTDRSPAGLANIVPCNKELRCSVAVARAPSAAVVGGVSGALSSIQLNAGQFRPDKEKRRTISSKARAGRTAA